MRDPRNAATGLLVLLPFALGAALAPWLLGWIAVAPNRLLSARIAPLGATGPVAIAWTAYHAALIALPLAAWRPARAWMAEAVGVLAALALLAVVGLGASAAVPPGGLARAAPAAGAWVALLLLFLAISTGAALRGATPALPLLAVLGGAVLLGVSGLLDPLSIMREALGRGEELRQALAEHVILSFSALLLALALSIPLSALSISRHGLEAGFLSVASGLQVIPAIALFGLLIVPLAALGAAFPALREMGLGGVGPAPAVIGITAYLLLPLARGLLAGFRVAPPALVEAALGQGLSPRQILWQLRVPLGAGVVLGALRLAAVQAVGLATLAALVGGGGLGAIVLQGVGQLAADLILLGVLPVLALSLAVDAGIALLSRRLAPEE
ncbi:ABC transporter permease subunit [Pararoseomonas baculiformis]|nr:ABC transporter permease subunit [Pararoseomonas baculiformis]